MESFDNLHPEHNHVRYPKRNISILKADQSRSLGFTRVQANALSAIGAFMTLPIVFFFAWVSDRTKKRGLTVIAAICCYLTVLVVARCVLPHAPKWSRFGMWTVVNAFAVCYHPVHNVWVQLNCADTAERSLGISYVPLIFIVEYTANCI